MRPLEPPVPSAFTPASDAAAAAWIAEGVRPWGKDRVRLWSFMPDEFDAYARVFHPAFRGEGNRGTVRWSELARRNGVALEPETGFRVVSGIDPSDRQAWDAAVPNDGTLEREQLEALSELLIRFTATPDRCWVAPWQGHGGWTIGSSSALIAFWYDGTTAPDDPSFSRPATEQDVVERARYLAAIPTIEIPSREYYLFTARVRDVPEFSIAAWHQAPSIWWPDDRAWCVITEVDGYSTYVGGSTACIEALLNSDEVEAISVTADVGIDPGPY